MSHEKGAKFFFPFLPRPKMPSTAIFHQDIIQTVTRIRWPIAFGSEASDSVDRACLSNYTLSGPTACPTVPVKHRLTFRCQLACCFYLHSVLLYYIRLPCTRVKCPVGVYRRCPDTQMDAVNTSQYCRGHANPSGRVS